MECHQKGCPNELDGIRILLGMEAYAKDVSSAKRDSEWSKVSRHMEELPTIAQDWLTVQQVKCSCVGQWIPYLCPGCSRVWVTLSARLLLTCHKVEGLALIGAGGKEEGPSVVFRPCSNSLPFKVENILRNVYFASCLFSYLLMETNCFYLVTIVTNTARTKGNTAMSSRLHFQLFGICSQK